MSEFALIRQHFARLGSGRGDVLLGVGDDCALLAPPAGQALAVSTDTLIEGVHFPPATSPEAVGYKALAVNLSDLAAMAAEPAWFTLALTLPDADAGWLQRFTGGLSAAAAPWGVQLVGGDTTRGSLTIGITVFGFVPAEQALRRGGAQPGDRLFVTGTLGDAAAGLALWQGRLHGDGEAAETLRERLQRPTPRLVEARALRGLASAAIDLSDGLCGDLGHLLAASQVGARIDQAALPLSPALRSLAGPQAVEWALRGGDDYELLFTVPPARVAALKARAGAWPSALSEIGEITARSGLAVVDEQGVARPLQTGYDHFATDSGGER